MTKTANIGNLKIGAKYPVRIKGMLKTQLSNTLALIKEAKLLEVEGAEAIRVALKQPGESDVIHKLKKEVKVPLVADIHFNHRLALEAIDNGFDGLRLNPLNIRHAQDVREVARKAKKSGIHIRIGINSGGFRTAISSDKILAQEMVSAVQSYIKILEKENFSNLSVSLKASTVAATILANRIFAKKSSYPLHIGVTATGPFLEGIVKSTLGIGMLLGEGLGSVVRVSLTAPSFWEIRVAKFILQALDMRTFAPEIISCPTCSRCQVDLIKIVDEFNSTINNSSFNPSGFSGREGASVMPLAARSCGSTRMSLPQKIAIMGCEVNGPGEARHADIGIAFGKGKCVVFKKNKILGTLSEANVIPEFLKVMGVK